MAIDEKLLYRYKTQTPIHPRTVATIVETRNKKLGNTDVETVLNSLEDDFDNINAITNSEILTLFQE